MPVPFTFANATNPIPLERLDANFTFLDTKVPVRAETADRVLLASQPNITSLGTLNNLNVNGTVTAGSMAANQILGVLATPFQPNITQLGALESLSVTGVITASALTATNITGQLLTAAQPNITSLGTLTGLTVTGTVTAPTVSGTLLTAAQPNITSLGTLTVLAVTGNVSGGNLSGTMTTAAQPNITSVGTLTALAVTGNVSGGNLNTTGNVTGNFILGNGSQLAGIDATSIQNGTANVRAFLNGNVAVSAAGATNVMVVTATGANITGTLSVTGNTQSGNLISTGIMSATGNITGGNLSGTSIVGTLTTAAQTNITSVGTLVSLGVAGNVTAVNFNGSAAGLTGLNMNNATTGTLSVVRGGTGTATATGSGSVVLNNSPSLVTPALGTPSSGTLTNTTGLPIVNGTTGTLSVGRGGTGATSVEDARTNLDVASRTGSGASGTWNISVVGPVVNAQFAGFQVERYQFPTSTFEQQSWTYDFFIGTRSAVINRPGAEGFYLRAQPLDFFIFTGLPDFQTWSVTKLAYANTLTNQSFLRYTVTSSTAGSTFPGIFWPNTYVFWLYRIVNPIID